MNILARASLVLSAALICLPAFAQTDPTIVGLPATSSITGAELLPIWQGGQRAITTLSAACATHAATAIAPTITGLPGASAITGGELVVLYQGRLPVATTVAALCSTHAAFAGDATLGLPGAAALTGTEIVPLYQGSQRETATVAQIATLFGGNPVVTSALDFSAPANSAFIL